MVLNTCCIRENADNKLYGHLGHLKSLQDASPGMQIAVGGCLAQKDRELVRRKAGHVDVVFGTHNLARAPELLRRAAIEGPVVEILDAPDPDGRPPTTRRPSRPCASCPTRPGSPSRRVRQLVRLLHRALGAGPRGQPAARPTSWPRWRPWPTGAWCEVTLLGQNVNSYGRDLTQRRPLFADLLRGGRRGRGHPPGPLHQPAPEGPAPRDDRGHGRDAGGVRAAPPAPAVGQRPGAGRHAPRLHGRAVPGPAGRGPRGDPRPGGHHRHHRRASPGETDDDFERPWRWWPRPPTTAPTPSSSRPARGPGRRPWRTASSPPEVVAERFERLRVVVERSALARHQARIGRIEEVLVEGPSRRDPAVLHRPHPPGQAGALPPRPGRSARVPAPGSFAEVEVTGAAPHHLTGDLRAGDRPPAAPDAYPGRRRLTAGGSSRGPGRWPSSAPRRRASRRWPWPWPGDGATSSSSRSTP